MTKPLLSQIKGIIFDMDGVLFVSGNSHEIAYRKVLATIGIYDFSYASVAGMRTNEAFAQLLSDQNYSFSPEELLRLTQEKQAQARQLLIKSGQIVNHSKALLTRLSGTYKLALASSASQQTIELFLAKLNLPDIFAICLDGSSVTKAKPDPEIYLKAAQALSLEPNECIVIEDAVSGVQAGKKAGMQVIGILGTDSQEALLSAGSAAVVLNLKKLESLLMEQK